MAIPYTTLNALTREYVQPTLHDNFFNGSPFLLFLKSKVTTRQKGGKKIEIPIIYAKNNACGNYSGSETIITTTNEKITRVYYNWAHAYVFMEIPRTSELDNAGKEKIVDIIMSEKKIAEKSLSDKVATQLFGSTATYPEFIGIEAMIDDSSTVEFGGIDSADFSKWAASVDTTSTVLTVMAMKKKFSACTVENEKPDIIVSNSYCEDKYWSLQEAKSNSVDKDTGMINFLKAKWIVDALSQGSGDGTQDNHISFINSKSIEFFVHPDDDFYIHDWTEPINQIGITSKITFTGQLICNARRLNGAFEAIDPAL